MSVSQSVSMDSRRCDGCGGCGGCEPGSWRTVVCGSHYQDVRKDAGDHHAQHKRAQPREAKLPTPDIHPARELAASVAASATSTGDSMRGRLRGRTCCRHSCGGVGSCAGSSAGSTAAVLPVRAGLTGAATQPASQFVVEALALSLVAAWQARGWLVDWLGHPKESTSTPPQQLPVAGRSVAS